MSPDNFHRFHLLLEQHDLHQRNKSGEDAGTCVLDGASKGEAHRAHTGIGRPAIARQVVLRDLSSPTVQLGELASLDVILIVFWFIVGPATLVLAIWSIVDAAGRPNVAFEAANTSKALWITLVAVLSFACSPIGIVMSIVYLASTRRRVKQAQDALPPPAYGVTASAYGAVGQWQQPPARAAPGWYRDPTDPSTEWWWDGMRYVSSRKVAPPTSPPSPPMVS